MNYPADDGGIMKPMKKTFPLGTVLSITTGRLLAPNGIGGVYEILNFMSGDNLFTHQLPRVMDECKPYLLQQFPQLADVDVSGVTGENWSAFMNELSQKLPADFEVEELPEGVHYTIEPLSELAEKVHPSRIAVVMGGSDGEPS